MDENRRREEKSSCCYFHPKQAVIGVCHLCLNERLLIVAAKQGYHHKHHPFTCNASQHKLRSSMHRKQKSASSIHKIFAFGSLFSRPEPHQLKSDNNYDDDDATYSPEDSFISIKFEENGVASWKKNTTSNEMSWNHHSQVLNKDAKKVIPHGKAKNAFRWRKRIGHLFHHIQWRRSTKSGVCHVGSKNKVEGAKVRKGWMRTLTKRHQS